MELQNLYKIGAILGIIQGILGAFGSLIGILLYQNAVEITSIDSIKEMTLYLIFISPHSKHANVFNITSRIIHKFLWSYFVLDLAWLFTSIALIQFFKNYKLSFKKSMLVLEAFLILAISATDLTLTVMIAMDIHSWQKMVLSTQGDMSVVTSEIVTAYKIVLILTARGGFVWFINVCFAMFYIKHAWDIKDNPAPNPSIAPYETASFTCADMNINAGKEKDSDFEKYNEYVYKAPKN